MNLAAVMTLDSSQFTATLSSVRAQVASFSTDLRDSPGVQDLFGQIKNLRGQLDQLDAKAAGESFEQMGRAGTTAIGKVRDLWKGFLADMKGAGPTTKGSALAAAGVGLALGMQVKGMIEQRTAAMERENAQWDDMSLELRDQLDSFREQAAAIQTIADKQKLVKKLAEEIRDIQRQAAKSGTSDLVRGLLEGQAAYLANLKRKEESRLTREEIFPEEKSAARAREALGANRAALLDARAELGKLAEAGQFELGFNASDTRGKIDMVTASIAALREEFRAIAGAELGENLQLPAKIFIDQFKDPKLFEKDLGRLKEIVGILPRLMIEKEALAQDLAGLDGAARTDTAGARDMPEIASDRWARIGLFVGSAGGPSVEYNRRTAAATERSTKLLEQVARNTRQGGPVNAVWAGS